MEGITKRAQTLVGTFMTLNFRVFEHDDFGDATEIKDVESVYPTDDPQDEQWVYSFEVTDEVGDCLTFKETEKVISDILGRPTQTHLVGDVEINNWIQDGILLVQRNNEVELIQDYDKVGVTSP